MPNVRQQITHQDLHDAIEGIIKKTHFRAGQKGLGAMASSHEILGIIEDEAQEYRDEVHAKSDAKAKIEELKDIAVAAIWGIASIQTGAVDW
jgi:ribosomal protein L1